MTPMTQLHPKILAKDGKQEFVVLPCEEFIALQEALEVAQDLLALEARRENQGGPIFTQEEVEREFGLRS